MQLFRARVPLVSFLLIASAASAPAQIHKVPDSVRRAELSHEAQHQTLIQVPMRDGVRLATDVYLSAEGDGPYPTVFWRTPYNTSPLAGSNPNRPSALLKYALDSVRRGYAFVVQNERGKFYSEGTWEVLGRPRTDGWDALTWIADQPWSNGKVATLGCSSTAEWQMGLASMGHPAHAAAVPMGQGAGIGRMGPYFEQGSFYRGGAIQIPMITWMYGEQGSLRPTFPAGTSTEDLRKMATFFDLARRGRGVDWNEVVWHLPLEDMVSAAGGQPGVFEESVRRLPGDEAWTKGGLYHDHEPYEVPSLWVNSWYDLSVAPNLALYQHARTKAAGADQFLVVAPTDHCSMYRLRQPHVVGEMNMGDVSFGMDDLLFDFLDAYTQDDRAAARGRYLAKHPRVKYFAMGRNEWRGADDWPPAPAAGTLTLHLHSSGSANSAAGDGALRERAPTSAAPDSFLYDPMNPVPTVGGNFCCLGNWRPGAFDQRGVEARSDVLVYTTPPLEAPLDVAGYVDVVLFVSSDAPDTDVTVKLVDVAPDGRALNLDDAILRLRYREGFDREVFLEPGQVVEARVGPLVTAHVFEAGHRVRLEVSSSNFPRYDRNLNTGGRNWDESEGQVATNVVHHAPAHASRIVLPLAAARQ